MYKACGTRRATQCRQCSYMYQGDALQVVRSGLIGGKGIPEGVASHPVVFATFTAPSFGVVHHRPVKRHVCRRRSACQCRPDPCRARSDRTLCEHGRPTSCHERHSAGDKRIGQPLCIDCYDHEHQVIWNFFSGELWRRTKQAIDRHLKGVCRARGIPMVELIGGSGKVRKVDPVRVAHGKVAEMQARGAVHFHTLLRLEGVDPEDVSTPAPPPAGITVEDLDEASTAAAMRRDSNRVGREELAHESWLTGRAA